MSNLSKEKGNNELFKTVYFIFIVFIIVGSLGRFLNEYNKRKIVKNKIDGYLDLVKKSDNRILQEKKYSLSHPKKIPLSKERINEMIKGIHLDPSLSFLVS